MESLQLKFIFEDKPVKLADNTEPYRNGAGELLPWEEPAYLESLKNEAILGY